MKNNSLFRVGDLLPMLLCAAAALALPVMHVLADDGAAVRVETPKGVETFPLDTDGTVFLDGDNGMAMTLLILDGKARVAEATCPDQLCVHTGWLTHTGDTAACLPSGILITVEGDSAAGGPDAVAR